MTERRWTYKHQITKSNNPEYKVGDIIGFSPAQARDFFMNNPGIEGVYIERVPYDGGSPWPVRY